MENDKNKIDWSQPCWREMLIYQRKSMWFDGALDKLAEWLHLKPGMTAVDVGCGLGYLGYTFWPYFGKGGQYIGLDISPKLLGDARQSAKEWSTGGQAHFAVANAYRLPLPDNFADWVMCQTLLIHLEKPRQALAEMVRVVRPGGLIFCHEPDNVSPSMPPHYWSLPQLDIEDELLSAKVVLLSEKGRIKLGRGDRRVGVKVPRMLHQMGVTQIGVRLNEKVMYLEPPYDDPLQQRTLENIKKQWLDDERRRTWLEREREEFLAGGGTADEFDRYLSIADRSLSALKQQFERGEYFACASGDLYIIKGSKPE